MTNAAWLTLLLATGALAPGAALGQEPAQLALARPQPHFVAAWAPKKEREAERSAVLARRVSLELTDVSLDAALKALTNQAGLRITYSPAVLPAGKRVTISASDVAVVTALTEMLFRSGLDVVVDRDGALALVRCRHVAPRAEVQDSGSIVGRVTDKGSGSPLVGATVVVEEMKLSATTGPDGRYRIRGVAAGTYTVRARYIGYALLSISVTVTAGGQEEADFALARSAQQLDQLVVTGTETPTAERALPNPISVITNAEIEEKHVQRVDQLFRGDVPGIFAWDRGTSNYFTTIDVRGASSLSVPGYIKTYIDGVEVTNPSYIATLDPYSIERIEVIRGPQASTIYGSDALNGVLQISLRLGRSVPGLTSMPPRRPGRCRQSGMGQVPSISRTTRLPSLPAASSSPIRSAVLAPTQGSGSRSITIRGIAFTAESTAAEELLTSTCPAAITCFAKDKLCRPCTPLTPVPRSISPHSTPISASAPPRLGLRSATEPPRAGFTQ
jgi:hypothetical protein